MTHAGELESCVRAALARHSRIPGIPIGPGDRLDGKVGLDSFALMNALLDVEDQLGIQVDPSRLAGVREMTLSELLALLAESASGIEAGAGAPAPPEAPR